MMQKPIRAHAHSSVSLPSSIVASRISNRFHSNHRQRDPPLKLNKLTFDEIVRALSYDELSYCRSRALQLLNAEALKALLRTHWPSMHRSQRPTANSVKR